ncbi:hypothetical protein M2G70_23160, partial [Vibrio vulnificus]|nr:hypothetical protein [Vibrio vulnificus]
HKSYKAHSNWVINLHKIMSNLDEHNALLRGEQRNTKAAANHLNHLNQRIVKTPRVANPS